MGGQRQVPAALPPKKITDKDETQISLFKDPFRTAL
jgi:hypothetical protein